MNLTQALGWTLIHFIWQGAAVAILLACALVLLRRSGARLRYAAACAAMILMLACAAATFLAFQFNARTSQGVPAVFPPSVSGAGPASLFIDAAQPKITVTDYLPLFVWAWFGGVVALSLRAFGGWIVASRFSRRHTFPAEDFWEEQFAALVKRLGILRPVRLAISTAARVPAVVGWLKPVVLMPAAVFTGLTPEQIEALLAHELAHVRRYDYVINMLQTAAETLLFYHPAIWWIGRCIRNERENCCDDLAVEICGNAATYVRALTDLEQLRGTTPAFAIAADGGSLLRRVERLLDLNSHMNSTPSGLLSVVGIAVVCVSVIGVQASGSSRRQQTIAPQAAQLPAAEVEPPVETAQSEQASGLLTEVAQAAPVQQAPKQETATQNQADWLDQIDAAGFHGLAVEKLIELKIHGVDGNYIQEIRAAGFDPSVDKLLELKIHGIDGEYIRQMRATGLQLTLDKLLEFRIHGITPEFISQQNQTGLGSLNPDKLLELKIHGVTPEYIQGIRSLGFSDITADKILELRIHGVTPDYVRDAKSHFKDLTLDQIIQLKIYNILK